MPNVLLTSGCNLSCEYCFAQEKMLGRRVDMAMDDVRKVISFLKRSECTFFRVMGGEPTLHPRFGEIVQLALQHGMHVDVLSNATWQDDCNDLFDAISPKNLLFLLNIDHPERYPARLWSRIERNLARLEGRQGITLSFNLFERHPHYKYIFDLTSRYRIRNVRMSFSLPVYGMGNRRLDLEEYEGMAPFILDFVHEAEEAGVTVRMDNAVPLCIFSYEQVGELVLKRVLDLDRNARCEPVIDIGPDLRMWFCFCLSKLYNRHLDEFETLQEVQEYYRRAISGYQDAIYAMDKCYDCAYRTLWGCQGGCLTYAIEKDGGKHLDVEPTSEPAWQPGLAVALAEGVRVRHYRIPSESYALQHADLPINIELDPSFASLWGLLDGRYTLPEVIDQFFGNGDGRSSRDPLDRFVQDAMQENVYDLLTGLLHEGILVQAPPGEKGKGR